MSLRPRLRPSAEADLREASQWYERKRPGLGIELLLELDLLLERVFDSSEQFPEIGFGMRRALLRRFPYAVYFVADAGSVVIVAVLHQRRKLGAWRNRSS